MAFPDFYLTSVLDIDLELLKQRGITTLLLDLDNTILPRDRDEIPSELKAWAAALPKKGFKVCLLSNNWPARLNEVAGDLGFEMVARAVKPLPPAYLKALHLVGSKPSETAMIGDQLFTDVLGATLIGATTIMVLPLVKKDLKHTLMLRHLERVVMRGRQPQDVMQ